MATLPSLSPPPTTAQVLDSSGVLSTIWQNYIRQIYIRIGGSNGSPVIPDGSITNALLADNSVSSSKIASQSVTNAKIAAMAAHTFKGNNTGFIASPSDLTAAQLTAELNAVMGDSGSGGTKGLVPAPAAGDAAAGKFLSAGGGYAVPSAGTIVQNQVFLTNGNGFGSTNTKIRRYSTAQINAGPAMTYADSATLGMSVTINSAGVYAVTVADSTTSTGPIIGFSVNASALTTVIESLTWAQGFRGFVQGSTGTVATISQTLFLNVNDVVRAHFDGTQDDVGLSALFNIVKVSQ